MTMTTSIGAHPALAGFQIVQELSGERGNKVFLARSKSGSLVAIKVLVSGAITDEARSALSKEATLGARLEHEAVLQTRSMLLEEDFAAVVTEFVPGVSLQRLLRFATGRGVRLPDVCAWYVFERVLAALASAHAQKDGAGAPAPVLHRGVSPSSVVVGWDGTVKVGDFGLVRMRQIVGSPSGQSGERDLPAIMAPEEVRNERPDARGDVFCAALLAVRLATGRTPYARFRGSRSEMTLALADANVARLAQTRPDLSANLRDAVDAALVADREARTMTASALLAEVRAGVDLAQGKAALAKLLGRWREQLEASVTPWERRASIPDAEPEAATGIAKPGVLALTIADERPSDGALVSAADPANEPWKKEDVAPEEAALAPTDPAASLSRLGSIAPDALVMPLPAMRITIPELPVYGGPAVNLPRPAPKQGLFSGGAAAAVIATMFVVLVGGAFLLFRWLLGPP